MGSACDGLQIWIFNWTQARDGTYIPMEIRSASPEKRDGKNGGTLSGVTTLPMTIPPGKGVGLIANSGSGSGGWVNGTIVCACNWVQSPNDPPNWEEITMNYTGFPSTVNHNDHCTATGETSRAPDFSVDVTHGDGKANQCWLEYTVNNAQFIFPKPGN